VDGGSTSTPCEIKKKGLKSDASLLFCKTSDVKFPYLKAHILLSLKFSFSYFKVIILYHRKIMIRNKSTDHLQRSSVRNGE
jgi:hypothetical protein